GNLGNADSLRPSASSPSVEDPSWPLRRQGVLICLGPLHGVTADELARLRVAFDVLGDSALAIRLLGHHHAWVTRHVDVYRVQADGGILMTDARDALTLRVVDHLCFGRRLLGPLAVDTLPASLPSVLLEVVATVEAEDEVLLRHVASDTTCA